MRLIVLTHGASLLAVLSSIVISRGAAYQLTSQYLGTAPSRDNEHLLLFKLPETISSQLLVESSQPQPQLQSNNHLTQQQHLNPGGGTLYVTQQHSQQQSQNNLKQYNGNINNNQQQYSTYIQQAPNSQQYEPGPATSAVQEQAVSLTIPLLTSALHAVEPTSIQTGASYVASERGNPTGQVQQTTSQHVNGHAQQALESALADYLVQANNQHADNSGGAQISLNNREIGAPVQQSEAGFMDQSSNSADLSTLRQLQRQLSLLTEAVANQPDDSNHRYRQSPPPIPNLTNDNTQQYSHLQLIAENNQQQQQQANYSLLSGNQQPRLWRDSQISYSPQQQATRNHSDVSSLIAKLANSSPDLLIRLKNLLKKTTSSSRIVASSGVHRAPPLYEHLKLSTPSESLHPLESLTQASQQDGAGDEYFMANNVAPRELKQLIQNYLDRTRQHEGTNGDSDNSNNSLKALLSNSNVTSHEEIKIPLILIAMPRILSFKKNNTGTLGNSSSLPTISKVLAQRLVGQLPHLLAAAAQRQNSSTKSTSYGRNGTANNLLYQLDTTSSSPQLVARANTTTDGGKQVYWVGQQPAAAVAATTNGPYMHTMAPYAQQFYTPRLASSPLANNGGGRRFIPMLNAQQATTYQTSPGVIRQLLSANQSDLYTSGQRNLTGPNQVLSLVGSDADQSGDVGFQVQLIGPSNEASGNIQQQKQYSPAVQSLPFYDVKQTVEQPNESQQQEEQRVIYVAPAAVSQRRSINPPIIGRFQIMNSTTNDETVQLRPPYDPTTTTRLDQTSYNEHQRKPFVSRLSLMEEQISKLRPLFQSAGKRSTSAADNRSKLNPSQLLTLFSPSTAKRSWTSSRASEDDVEQSATTQQQQFVNDSQGKKSPKMVFMIV